MEKRNLEKNLIAGCNVGVKVVKYSCIVAIVSTGITMTMAGIVDYLKK